VSTNERTESAADAAHEELTALLRRAEQGDRSVEPAMQQALCEHPSIWRHYGDLAAQAEAALVTLAAGANLLLAESLTRKLAEMRRELGGESPSPLEALLVRRVTATWLQISYLDALRAQAAGAGEARLRMLQAQQDAAHRRHLTAVKTLATVRKLLTPSLSPVEIATRLDRPARTGPRVRAGVAGAVPAHN
jgi:hypothetical protein